MKPRSSLIAFLIALALGSFWYFYDLKGGQSRSQASSQAKLVFPELSQFEPSELALRAPNRDEIFLQRDGETWHIFKPLSASVDSFAVQQVLQQLKAISNEGTVAEKDADLREFGLDKPSGAVTYRPLSGPSQVLFFGNDNPSQQYSYSMIDGKPAVFMVPRFAKAQILRELKDLRNKEFWNFEPGQVMQLRSSFGKGLALERLKDGSWQLSKPVKGQGEKSKVEGWLSQISALHIGEFDDEAGKVPTNYGIGLGARIEISLAEQAKPLVLMQGYRSKGKVKGHYYQLQGRPLIFEIDDSSGAGLIKDAAALLSQTASSSSGLPQQGVKK